MPAKTESEKIEEKLQHHPLPDIGSEDDDGEMEENLYLAPDGSMTSYFEGDEEDPNSVWFGKAPTFIIGNTDFCVTDLPGKD